GRGAAVSLGPPRRGPDQGGCWPQELNSLMLGGFAMTVLTVALAIHQLAATRPVSGLACGVPNPAPQAPPGLAGPVNTVPAWWGWGRGGAWVAGVWGWVGWGALWATAPRTGSTLAAAGATGPPWVFAGLTLIALSPGIVGFLM